MNIFALSILWPCLRCCATLSIPALRRPKVGHSNTNVREDRICTQFTWRAHRCRACEVVHMQVLPGPRSRAGCSLWLSPKQKESEWGLESASFVKTPEADMTIPGDVRG
jgi:hypothetical protein